MENGSSYQEDLEKDGHSKCSRCGKQVASSRKKYCNATCKNAHWYSLNAEKNKMDAKHWRDSNKDHRRKKISEYKKTVKFKIYKSLKDKKKRLENPGWRIAVNLRSRLSKALKRVSKTGSAIRDLGCQIIELQLHLQSLFQPGMSWDNYGEWHIDHIKPLASFNLSDPEELKMACHYTNLQPMWAKDNRLKSNKEVCFEQH